MWVLLFPVGKIPGNQDDLQLSFAAHNKRLQHLPKMALDSVDGDGHLVGDFHIAVAQAGISGRILLPRCQAVPAQQVVIGEMVLANGKGEKPVHGFRDGQAFFVGNVFDEGNEVRVNVGKVFWRFTAVMLEECV